MSGTEVENDARIYPCRECGVMRSKDEGGTVFTVCDQCWDKLHDGTGRKTRQELLVEIAELLVEIAALQKRPALTDDDLATLRGFAQWAHPRLDFNEEGSQGARALAVIEKLLGGRNP